MSAFRPRLPSQRALQRSRTRRPAGGGGTSSEESAARTVEAPCPGDGTIGVSPGPRPPIIVDRGVRRRGGRWLGARTEMSWSSGTHADDAGAGMSGAAGDHRDSPHIIAAGVRPRRTLRPTPCHAGSRDGALAARGVGPTIAEQLTVLDSWAVLELRGLRSPPGTRSGTLSLSSSDASARPFRGEPSRRWRTDPGLDRYLGPPG